MPSKLISTNCNSKLFMKTKTNLKQIKHPTARIIIKAEMIITMFSVIFAFVNSEFWCAIQPHDCSLRFYMFYFSRTLIFPSILVVFLGGLLLWLILPILNNGKSNILASILGLIISIALVFIIDYALWIILQPRDYLSEISFIEFAISKFRSGWFYFIFFVNPFFVPSMIAAIIVTYLGWKMSQNRFSNFNPTARE